MKALIANLSTRHKLQLATILSVVLALVPVLLMLGASSTLTVISLALAIVLAWFISSLITQPVNSGIKALETGLLNFKDGEFSSLLAYSDNDELGRLCRTYNQTAEQLRQEKQWIYQRELMLDKVLQSSPQALVLIDSNSNVVFSNHSAKLLFNSEHK